MRRTRWATFGALAVAIGFAVTPPARTAEPRATLSPVFEDSIAQRMKACVVCHGEHGGGIVDAATPRLAGQPAAYLASQMKAFRDGRRTYGPMNFLMSRQTDTYLDEIAAYFSAQAPDPRVVAARTRLPVDRSLVEAGRALVREGRPDAGLPACVGCHGARMGGMLPAIPALAGMPRDFLMEQVGSWKTGAHRSSEPDCMALIAKRMTGNDIVAAASWLSLQQPDTRPEVPSAPLPIACGFD